ncbi:hypothetical protein [Sphingosinicella sp.]|uniref:hypothetical protein n=1 Tax=Sphingosinicella sp. TaxID=1917971 RepID=UPI0040377EF7
MLASSYQLLNLSDMFSGTPVMSWVKLIGLMFVGILIWGIGYAMGEASTPLPAGVRRPETEAEYPPVKRLLDQGWEEGTPAP